MNHSLPSAMLLAFLLVFVSQSHVASCENRAAITERFYHSQYELFSKGFSNIFWSFIRQANLTGGSSCHAQLTAVLIDLDRNSLYATQLVRASGGFPSVFENKTYAALGDYDSCLHVDIPSSEKRSGQYCVMSLAPDRDRIRKDVQLSEKEFDFLYPVEFSEWFGRDLKVGICIPSTCSSQELSNLLAKALEQTYWTQTQPCNCQIKRGILEQISTATVGQLISLFGIAFSVLVVCWAGVLDLKVMLSGSSKGIKEVNLIHRYFSPRKNLEELIAPLEGSRFLPRERLRLFSYVLVYQLHVFIWPFVTRTSSILGRQVAMAQASQRLWSQPFLMFWHSEGLILLAANSASISFVTSISEKASFKDWFNIILERFVRYQPVVLLTIALDVALPFFGHGPVFDLFTQQQSEICSRTFTYTLFFATNLVDTRNICLFHTWSMSVEFQLVFVGAALFFLYLKADKLGSLLSVVLIIGGLAYTIRHFVHNNIPVAHLLFPFKMSDTFKFFDLFYIHPSFHLWNYVLMVYVSKLCLDRIDEKLPKKFLQVALKASLCLIFINLYSTGIFNIFHLQQTPLVKILYILVTQLVYVNTVVLYCFIQAEHFRSFLSEQVKWGGKKSEIATNSEVNFKSNHEARPERASKEPNRRRCFAIFSKLAKAAYFPHATFITWYLSSFKEPLPMFSLQYWFHLCVMMISIFLVGFVFRLFMLGPYEKIYADFKAKFITKKNFSAHKCE